MENFDNSELEENNPSAQTKNSDQYTYPNTGYRKIRGWLEKTKQEVQKVKIDRYTNTVLVHHKALIKDGDMEGIIPEM